MVSSICHEEGNAMSTRLSGVGPGLLVIAARPGEAQHLLGCDPHDGVAVHPLHARHGGRGQVADDHVRRSRFQRPGGPPSARVGSLRTWFVTSMQMRGRPGERAPSLPTGQEEEVPGPACGESGEAAGFTAPDFGVGVRGSSRLAFLPPPADPDLILPGESHEGLLLGILWFTRLHNALLLDAPITPPHSSEAFSFPSLLLFQGFSQASWVGFLQAPGEEPRVSSASSSQARATWLTELRRYARLSLEKDPLPAKDRLSPIEAAWSRIVGATLATSLQCHAPSIAKMRSKLARMMPNLELDANPLVVCTSARAGLVAMREILGETEGPFLLMPTRWYEKWTDSHPDEGFRWHIHYWSGVLPVRHPRGLLESARRKSLPSGSSWWIHHEGILWGPQCGKELHHLWEWDGSECRLLHESFLIRQF